MKEIDRLARAISPDWRTMSANSKENARITVRALLRELREPTEAMSDAGTAQFMCRHEDTFEIWRAMIDALIAECS